MFKVYIEWQRDITPDLTAIAVTEGNTMEAISCHFRPFKYRKIF